MDSNPLSSAALRLEFPVGRCSVEPASQGARPFVLRFAQHISLRQRPESFDFAIDATGTWFFLEANTAGQYGFLETHTGAAISNALADLLAGGAS